MKVRNLGRKSLEEVLAKLKELGLELSQGVGLEHLAKASLRRSLRLALNSVLRNLVRPSTAQVRV